MNIGQEHLHFPEGAATPVDQTSNQTMAGVHEHRMWALRHDWYRTSGVSVLEAVSAYQVRCCPTWGPSGRAASLLERHCRFILRHQLLHKHRVFHRCSVRFWYSKNSDLATVVGVHRCVGQMCPRAESAHVETLSPHPSDGWPCAQTFFIASSSGTALVGPGPASWCSRPLPCRVPQRLLLCTSPFCPFAPHGCPSTSGHLQERRKGHSNNLADLGAGLKVGPKALQRLVQNDQAGMVPCRQHACTGTSCACPKLSGWQYMSQAVWMTVHAFNDDVSHDAKLSGWQYMRSTTTCPTMPSWTLSSRVHAPTAVSYTHLTLPTKA